jgi:hypothetical protein
MSPNIRGFIVTARYKLEETVRFMHEEVDRYPELKIFKNNAVIPERLYATDPDLV